MKKLTSLSLTLLTVLFALIASERAAYAYVDPGSGLLALQGIASVLAAAGFYMRKRIALLFSKSPAAPAKDLVAPNRKAA